ncbi:MAG: 1-aminocyclopropane-1-carboxylate deaminase/D-cysteine desulfhydrase [Gammaproteobacteria bacterium]
MITERPLHTAYPRLASALAHLPLAQLPTPICPLPGSGPWFCKDDGGTHTLYGGNKVRKLEYVFGQAQRHGCTQVATFGAAGSNHATATALHAQRLGLRCINFLSRQRQTPWVANNIKRQLASGAQLVFVDGHRVQREQQAQDVLDASAHKTWLIPMGGSSIAGTVGYVNAAFELRDQIKRGEMPVPRRVYAPLGTMGTVVGLALGFAAVGLATEVVGVRVVHESIGSEAQAKALYAKTARALHRLDPQFPALDYASAKLTVRNEFFGAGYAVATDEARAAVDFAADHWALKLETTYSGKAAAALLADSSNDASGTSLFWSTYSSPTSTPEPDASLLDTLPRALHSYLVPQVS